jgi:hypothetical protein
LNEWLTHALPKVEQLLDVGSNDGYFALGTAEAFRRNGVRGRIICFEPDVGFVPGLEAAAQRYKGEGIEFEIVPRFVGCTTSDPKAVRLADFNCDERPTLIKVDVEGAEVDVLRGCGHWLSARHLFLIEVHAHSLLAPLVELAASRGISLRQIDQKPHWLLGRESRDLDNRWLVSDI